MISLLVINYRSAALAAEAIRSARAASREPLQVVVVDNSCDAAEADPLRGVADVLVVSETNRGYAGGINLGRRSCDGNVIVVANPDVIFAAEAIDRLVEQLNSRTAVAGPALFWDDAHTWFLPPNDLHTAWEKLDEVLASRSQSWFQSRDRRRFRARVRFWSLREPEETRALSGAVMAIRAEDFDAVGGFDERFALYFEETDFLRRITEHRKRIVYVPAAKCRHLYNQSAGEAPESAQRFADSELRYLEKWNGPSVARLLKRFERSPRSLSFASEKTAIALDRDDVIIEASPLASFATAAGHFPTSRHVVIPDEIHRAYKGDALYLRVVELSSGRIVELIRIPL
ncbi:MAG TPA: glycosyltransferase [Thermoanaerobaculia bacterium]|nr:glycosyltransferase [Thermoanaerobaculia bacterium]